MEEVWKDIDGFSGLYQISNFGNVKSLNYRGSGQAKNLTPKLNCKGYLWVILYKGAKHKCALIHRLVGDAFLENESSLPVINHKDENPLNNRADNLEWCSRSYNARYSLQLHPERIEQLRQVRIGKARKHKNLSRTTKILQFDKKWNLVREWENLISIKHETGWNEWSIEECCKGNRKSSRGYYWQYAN